MFEPQIQPTTHLEWGPAHLRDDAPVLDIEPTDRPDDN